MIVNYTQVKLKKDRFMQGCEFDMYIVGTKWDEVGNKIPDEVKLLDRLKGCIIGTKSFRLGTYDPGTGKVGFYSEFEYEPPALVVTGSINCYKVLTGFNKVYYVPQDQVYTNFYIDATDVICTGYYKARNVEEAVKLYESENKDIEEVNVEEMMEI